MENTDSQVAPQLSIIVLWETYTWQSITPYKAMDNKEIDNIADA